MNTISDPISQLEDPTNITKYKDAGKITAVVLDTLIAESVPGKSIKELCQRGDALIMENVAQIYPSINHKGICFPTCISVNNIVGNHIAPYTLKLNDVVKIELGVHIDGFPARVCTTVFIGQTITKEVGQLFQALSEAGKAIIKLFTEKHANMDVMELLKEVAAKYNCSILTVKDGLTAPGTVSYQVSRNVIDGFNEDDDEWIHQLIIHRNHPEAEITMRRQPFINREVYCVDIAISLGPGLITRSEEPSTVYKRVRDKRETLKLKSSMATLNTFKTRFPMNVSDKVSDTRFRLGLKECVSKGLIEEYAVFKDRGTVGRSMFTVIVNDEPTLITGRSLDTELKKIEM